MNFNTLRNIQGLHAPLKLQMEYRAARQVLFDSCLHVSYTTNTLCSSCLNVALPFVQIQRLPFLPSSNLALDTLRGSDDTIGFEDILNGTKKHPTRYPSCSQSFMSLLVPWVCFIKIWYWWLLVVLVDLDNLTSGFPPSDPIQCEMMGDPHIMTEYKLGVLWGWRFSTSL